MTRFRRSEWVSMRWRNGGGTTHEILREPSAGDPSDFSLRVSVAEVATSGPFSLFPGIDRSILLLQGDGFVLTRQDGLRVAFDRPGVPFGFHGEDRWSCDLRSPVLDLNVMWRRNALRVAVAVHTLDGASGEHRPVGRALIFALSEGLRVDELALEPWDLIDAVAPRITGSGRCLVASVGSAGDLSPG